MQRQEGVRFAGCCRRRQSLAGRIVELSAEMVVDLRPTGTRVRLDSDEHAEAVSAAARDLGLAANPAVLQHLSVVFESANPSVVRRFWQRVLDYAPGEDGGLLDPLRRDPAIRIRPSTEPRPLRNRIHLDVRRCSARRRATASPRRPSSVIWPPRQRRWPTQTRLAATVAAGGRLLDESDDRWRVADPEGNEMVIVSGA